MNKFTVVAIAVILLCFGGLIFWSVSQGDGNGINVNYANYDDTKVIEANEDNGNIGDHVRGKVDSKVVVVEYADMSCPGCATMTPRITKLYEEYGDRVAFVFRHFPLKDHQNSRSAAAAVESAGSQGFYWEMLEALYANRSDWLLESGMTRTDTYVKIFKKVAPNGDEEKFRNDMKDASIEKKIAFDYGLGKEKSKVEATPALYVNGEAIQVAKKDATFDDIINEMKTKIEAGLAEDEDTGVSEEKK